MKDKKELQNQKLKTILRKVGRTPIEEPEIYELINGEKPMFRVVDFVITRADNTLEKIKASNSDLALFFYKIKSKVTDFKTEKDIFKQTEATKELDALNFEQSSELGEMYSRISIDGVLDEEVQEEMKSYALEHCNLDVTTLTEWEKDLVALQLSASSGDERQLAILGNLMTS